MRERGALALAFLVVIIATAEPAHADTVPSPDPTVEVVDQPALPAGPIPSIEPSVPEGDFEPAPTEPVPTAFPTVPPPAPLGTATFDPTRPSGTVVETFRSGDASTTSRGTDGSTSRDTAPAPQGTEPEQERTESPSASPTPAVPTASPSPVVATASPAPGDARGDSAGSGAAVRSISAPKAPAPTVPTLILGIAVLVAGLLLMRYRTPMYHAVVRTGNRRIATSSGERVEGLQGPFRLGVAGAVIALVGVTMNGYAAWQLLGSLSS